MTSAEFLPDYATGTIGAVCAVDVSGLMYAPTAKKLSILDKVFNEWLIKPDRVAYRRP